MSSILKIIVFISGLIYTFTVISLLVRRKINERNTLVWLSGSIVILIVSANPSLLDWVADRLGVDYPPSLLFLFSMLVLLLVVLYQSIQISILNEKVKQLAQFVSMTHVSEGRMEDIEKED